MNTNKGSEIMLNKKGWGLGVFFLFLGIFILCLLFSAWGFKKIGLLDEDWKFVNLGDFFSGNVTTFDYSALEKKMIDAAEDYMKKEYNNELPVATLNVTAKTLVEKGYLEELKDGKDRACSGYVSVNQDNGYSSYLKCKRYTTSGYEKRKDI